MLEVFLFKLVHITSKSPTCVFQNRPW